MNLDHAFQVSPRDHQGNFFSLTKPESNHAIRVLRLQKDDEICLLDGLGNGYRAIVEIPNPDCVSGTILQVLPDYGENTYCLLYTSPSQRD